MEEAEIVSLQRPKGTSKAPPEVLKWNHF